MYFSFRITRTLLSSPLPLKVTVPAQMQKSVLLAHAIALSNAATSRGLFCFRVVCVICAVLGFRDMGEGS